ncbi:MAG: hypothetical protein F6K00_29860 [Leptolyngbya sp. SIOISBB]|nr:hypothetical protein [Leptolyngbya sp. SIOISBB]
MGPIGALLGSGYLDPNDNDNDNDGRINSEDLDDDNDGIPDWRDPDPWRYNEPGDGPIQEDLIYGQLIGSEGEDRLDGGSNGDPHLTTLDGVKYDLQTVGEFTLLKSTTDDFEIQTRHQPWGNRTDVSVNAAVAIQLDGNRIGFYLGQNPPLLINGTPVDLPDGGIYALGSSQIVREGDLYTVTSAQNDQIQIGFSRRSFINIGIGLSETRQSNVVGLLGNNNDDRSDDFALRDGTVIGDTISIDQLYGEYANSWRITQADSLFDYAPGTDTTTFTDLSFPENIITLDTLDPEVRAEAEAIARAAGITDPDLLAEAIFDIALTGADPAFIEGYTALQRQETVNGTNTLVNPDGFGDEYWLAASTVIPYTIRFSNTSDPGTDPVAQVTITQQLDADLDLNTFALGNFGFGDIEVTVPLGVQAYSQRLDLEAPLGIFVDVIAGLDIPTRTVTWTFTAIDPTTGNPVADLAHGFLPSNDDSEQGQGFVTYSIQPQADSPTQTPINGQAAISFDDQSPISTAAVVNTLDADLPTSQVAALPQTSDPSFTVSWSGTDVGSGLATYDIYVSENGGDFTLWLKDTAETSATYTGIGGSTYAFYSFATDNVGYREVAPTTADAVTFIGSPKEVPTAEPDTFENDAEDGSITGNVLANDGYLDTDTLTVSLITAPTNGTLTLNEDGSFEYVPFTGFSGSDSFTYEVSNGLLTDTATVDLSIDAFSVILSEPMPFNPKGVFFDYAQSLRFRNPGASIPQNTLGGLPLAELFDASYYLAQNPDVAAAVGNNLDAAYQHFVQFGIKEGRNPSALFNEGFYLAQNQDIAQAVAGGLIRSGLEHFLLFGHKEQRDPSQMFDQSDYLTNNPDVAAAAAQGFVDSAFAHYILNGIDENRLSTAPLLFNEAFYLQNNPDIAAAVTQGFLADGFEHFARFGQREGRAPSELYNEATYLALNPDVNAAVTSGALTSGFQHYELYGRFEGRTAA